MGKQQFMAELKQLLGDIPAEERDEALSYYEEYFNDAGEENEQQLIMQLESPEKVARSIKSGLEYADEENGEFSETGFSGFYSKDKNEIINTIPDDKSRGFGRFGGDARSNRLLLIILLILFSPIIFSVLGSIIGIAGGILGALFGILVALFAGGFGIIVGGLACIIASFPVLAVSAAASIIVAGAGFILIALGLLSMWAGKKFATVVIPGGFRLAYGFIKRIWLTIISRFKMAEV